MAAGLFKAVDKYQFTPLKVAISGRVVVFFCWLAGFVQPKLQEKYIHATIVYNHRIHMPQLDNTLGNFALIEI